MNTDFRISVTCVGHLKTKRLIRSLGHEAFYSLACLWTYTAVYRPKGVLTDMTREEIEDESEWSGEPGKFVETLIDLGFLDMDESGELSVHDWREHNGYASGAPDRAAKARKAGNARWGHDAQQENEHHAQNGIEHDARIGNGHDAPKPSPSPYPLPKDVVCAERSPAGDHSAPSEQTPEPYGIDIPLVDGTSYAVTKADVEQWQDAYPGVDVPAELKRIRSWADSNERKRKTRKGIRRCVNQWLAREQDRGGRNERASPRPRAAEPVGKQIGGLTF